MESYYRKHLAYIHNTHYRDMARHAAQEILVHSNIFELKRVIDLGCGSGILASVLSHHGMEVVGVDISSDLLEIAKEQSPRSTFINASIFDFRFDFCDIVCAVGEPFNYLFDEKAGYQSFTDIIRKVYHYLNPSGFFIFDILTDEVDSGNKVRMMEQEDHTMFIEIDVDNEKTLLTRKMTFFIKNKNCYLKDSEVHQQLLFNIDQIEEILNKTGFRFERLQSYNKHKFREGHYGFLCRK